ncbi:hypothetical protein C4569_00090 [Candidatus Parcubacteria bacterium]|nr:MAG: hypothetical protein C4569_00090 [Candidatus Parcubacteria bacterium]
MKINSTVVIAETLGLVKDKGEYGMLKKAKYRNWGYPAVGSEFGEVVYAIIGRNCFFSGIQRSFVATSTINAEESIVCAIAEQEGKAIGSLIFYDLQTHLGYDKPAGEFCLNRLTIKQANSQITITGWEPVSCPDNIRKIFEDYIGKTASSAEPHTVEQAQKLGYVPTEMRSPDLGRCQEYIRILGKECQLMEQMQANNAKIANIARALLAPPEHETHIIVVNGQGEYSVWRRDVIQDN